ncbi:major facilitator superfamily domain-containing protein [Pisolithus marmoratus]|nr:major facilitator superfamily domain-containing protein [Pisolithus marmoratus]
MLGALQTGFDGEAKGADPRELDHAAERRLRRKLDLRLMPVVVFVAIMNSMDAITFARLQGLQSDLHLTELDVQYDTVLAVTYALYFSALVPSNMFVHHTTRPSIYIGCCVVLWGVITTLTGLTKNYATMVTCRLLLGLPEAAIYPGCLYLLSSWYTRKELGLRTAFLIAGGLMAIAFGSLWAAAVLGTMEGKLHIAAWRWLFFIEGIVTVAVGILSMWLLPDYPRNTRWLNAEERSLAQLRLAKDVGEADMEWTGASIFEGLWMVIKDAKAYFIMIMSFSVSLSTSFAVFFPTLTATLGYSTTVTLLIAALVLFSSHHRTGERFFHLVIYWWISIIGFVISLSTMETAARYFSQYLMAMSFSGIMLLIPWIVSAIPRPPSKRSVTIALMNGFTNLGFFVGSYAWKESWSPQYHPSLLISLFSLFAATAFAFIIRTMQIREKKHVERQEIDDLGKDERERIQKAAELEGVSFDDAFRRRRQLPNI